MKKDKMPQIPYGAVYFRKSNPPKQDWERDYARASQDGINIFRHWFMWGAVETSPGHFDWEDYDRQMDLAAKYGIKTIIAEMITSAPEWAYRKYNDALYMKQDGSRIKSTMGGSSSTGGFGAGSAGGFCLDNEVSRELAGNFLKELVKRYKDHEAMLGYDIWNECNYASDICYCPATQKKFRSWLEKKYGSLKALNEAWHRYSYSEWEDVFIPVQASPYPECMDWLQFKKDNFYEQMQWRVDLIRSLDDKNLIAAHGVAGSINNMAAGGADDWMAASKVELYGYTWVASRKGSEPWKQWHAVDLVRSASRGKTFWHAEAQGGPLWLQPQVIGRPADDGRITKPEDIRIWNMISLAGGARGILYPRWRPLLDGPLYGAFGPYGMNGLPTPRSEMASSIAKWSNEETQRELFASAPVKGDIGIVVVPETQQFDYLLCREGKFDFYSRALWGAYKGFFDNNIQADWVHIDDIDGYDTLYLPYPIMLSGESAAKLRKWVENGGSLISEGCPGYFGDGGSVGAVQPNYSLNEVFGAQEEDVEFMPDISRYISFEMDGKKVNGGLYLQSYKAESGRIKGKFSDGRTAVIENSYGAGKTLLIGTFPSEEYYRTSSEQNREFFTRLMDWSGKSQNITVSDSRVQARLSTGDEGRYLWLLNPSAEDCEVEVEVSGYFGDSSLQKTFWGNFDGTIKDNRLKAYVPAKDVLIIKVG